ncbi:MAG TPA: glycogen debranching N-terminal domain-containing protein, partial [Chroococcales cyanobacterium]
MDSAWEKKAEPARVEIGGEFFHIDEDMTRFMQKGLPAVLTGCSHTRQVIKQEALFLICGADGDVSAGCGCGMGLYTSDTRFLSGLAFKLEDQHPTLLSFTAERNYMAHIESMNHSFTLPDGQIVPQETLYFSNTRAIGKTMREEIRVINFNNFDVPLRFSLEFRADYADIFEIRNYHRLDHGIHFLPKLENDQILFSYQGRDGVLRQTRIRFLGAIPRLELLPIEHYSSGAIARFDVLAPKNGQVTAFEYQVEAIQDGKGIQAPPGDRPFAERLTSLALGQEEHLSSHSRLKTNNEIYNLVLDRGLVDLACMTTFHPSGPFIEAGIPWYTSPFGRDSLITGYQTLMLGPKLSKGVLHYLAAFQGKIDDPFFDEEPGKILHEQRFGELANLGEVPQKSYYGSIDSTLLFLILLSETFRWTGDLALVRELWDAVEQALMWIDAYGDIDGDGFVEYQCRSPVGLNNQAWKDSWNSVIFPDSTLAEAPIAMAEVQGYVYDAKKRIAELCYLMDLRILGDRLVREAEDLKLRFNSDFWSQKDGFFVMALDAKKRQVNTLASNPGHCLWSGIVAPEKIPILVQQFMSPAMFSGWGIRTISADSPVYNPLSYHNGTVWPHDNSLIARGMADNGYKEEAVTLMDSFFQASLHFDYHRLPELFC